ncbi:lytic transglycosylase domain-containing protein [Nocardia sp. 348MFTsu5.1]|uniref:lytic transglycosylase domain-containing protein n=1 Tax=Nocardia sp. 348MFTsu5.1 TaxID=1172185 RepID=UPI00039B07BA|nr:lytic transglycosylase domain-containing protein [Nocardia sp. 348MFTsu5.1]
MGKHSAPKKRLRSPYALAALVPVGLVSAVAAAHAGQQLTTEPPKQVAESAPDNAPTAAPTIPSQNPVALPITTEPAPVAAPEPAPEVVPESVTTGQIPLINYEAYHAAGSKLAQELPGCGISWQLIAGIGRVESTHANNGKADPDGVLEIPILGPVLDGSLAGNNVIHDTDGGELDGDPHFDRAVGPMQFLPETWKRYAEDGNSDGVTDPQNLFDAALTTGRYLCDGNLDLRDSSQVTKAVLRYNNSMDYVSKVRGWADRY